MNSLEIENQITDAIRAIPDQFPNGARDTLWTRAIKSSLGYLGRSSGYSVCTSGMREHFDGAWLYDLCWYECTREDQFLNMPLALESEWKRGYADIKYDFEKLLVAKAKIKVMIFQASGASAVEYLDRLERGIRVYQGGSAGEVYLLACFDEASWKFKIRRVEGA